MNLFAYQEQKQLRQTNVKVSWKSMSSLVLGAWDGIHVHVACRLKNQLSFKNKYTTTSMGLIAHNKSFLHLSTSALSSTHDVRLFRYSTLFKDIQSGGGIPNKSIILGDFGDTKS